MLRHRCEKQTTESRCNDAEKQTKQARAWSLACVREAPSCLHLRCHPLSSLVHPLAREVGEREDAPFQQNGQPSCPQDSRKPFWDAVLEPLLTQTYWTAQRPSVRDTSCGLSVWRWVHFRAGLW